MSKKDLKVNYQFITDRSEQEIEDRLSKVFGLIFSEIEKNENKIHQATIQ